MRSRERNAPVGRRPARLGLSRCRQGIKTGPASTASVVRSRRPDHVTQPRSTNTARLICWQICRNQVPAALSAARGRAGAAASRPGNDLNKQTRRAVQNWLGSLETGKRYLFPSRFREQLHISTRQYARIVDRWVESAGLDSAAYGTYSMRQIKAAQIYRKTSNLGAVQLLLGLAILWRIAATQLTRKPNR